MAKPYKFKHVRDLKIDGRLQRVLILTESDERILYIPIKLPSRVDYEAFKEIDKQTPTGGDMLNTMQKFKLENGRLAIIQYEKLMQVAVKEQGKASRIPRPEEAERGMKIREDVAQMREARKEETVLGTAEPSLPYLDVEDPKDLYELGVTPEYVFRDKDGKMRSWSGRGRMPNVLKEQVEDGKKLSSFRSE